MRSGLRITGLLLFFCITSSKASDPCSVTNNVFRSGERLDYQLFYNVSFVWIQAGTCQFNARAVTYNGEPAFKLSADGKTYKSFDSFFKVRDTLISYVDSNQLLPIRAYKYTHEDNWHGIDDFAFHRDGNQWRVVTRLYRRKEWKPTQVSKTVNCGFDILTSLYRMRCLVGPESYKVGQRIEIPVRLDDDEYIVYLKYVGKEKIKLHKVGYYRANAFTINLVEGTVFKRGDVLKIWISDDGNAIPLLVESPIRVGSVKAILKNAERTLFPLQQPSQK
jgi:hypothetical protein